MRTIAHISDIHFGADDPPVVEGLVEDLSHREPDLLVVSGDFTQRARGKQFRRAMEFISRLPGPQLFVPGNHDIPLRDVLRRFFTPLANYKKYVTADLMPTYQDDELLVVGVNTARPISKTLKGFWKDGRIGRRQLLKIEGRCAAAPDGLFKVVVTHHPFLPPPGGRPHGIILGARRALATLERAGVDLLLAGHLHMNYSGDVRSHHEATKRSILSVQAGTACSTRRRGEPNAYNWISIGRDRVEIEVRTWGGAAFGASTLKVFERVAGEWRDA